MIQRNQRRDVRPEPGSHGTLNERSQHPDPLQGPCGKGAQPPAPWAGSSQQLGDDQGQGALSPQEPDQPPSDQGVVVSQLQSRGPIGDSSPGLTAHRGQGGGPRPGALCPDAAFSVASAGAKPEDGRQPARSGPQRNAGWGGGLHVLVSTRRGRCLPLAQVPSGTDCCLAPACHRSRRRMTPSNCPTPSTTSPWGGGRSQMSPWAACPCGPCLCRGR